jgi:hypothetical protein
VQVEAGIEPAFEDARADLELLLDQAELFAEYPLRLIEATRWRELNQVLQYDYRDLPGDHPLVPKTGPSPSGGTSSSTPRPPRRAA